MPGLVNLGNSCFIASVLQVVYVCSQSSSCLLPSLPWCCASHTMHGRHAYGRLRCLIFFPTCMYTGAGIIGERGGAHQAFCPHSAGRRPRLSSGRHDPQACWYIRTYCVFRYPSEWVRGAGVGHVSLGACESSDAYHAMVLELQACR